MNFEDAYHRLAAQLSNLYKSYTYLLKCPDIDADDKEIFRAIKAGKADKTQVGQALSTLIRLMQIYYQQQVILLLDEYDVPIAKANDKGYYQEMLDLMKGLLSTALKDNRSLRFSCITGCLRIAKESIFTGTNNLVTDGIASSGLQEYFGFTQEEVDQLLEDAELTERAAEITDPAEGRIAIFEAKYAKQLDDMQNQCQKALQQIDTKMYAEEYKDDYDQILCYGISFFKKRCLVKKK